MRNFPGKAKLRIFAVWRFTPVIGLLAAIAAFATKESEKNCPVFVDYPVFYYICLTIPTVLALSVPVLVAIPSSEKLQIASLKGQIRVLETERMINLAFARSVAKVVRRKILSFNNACRSQKKLNSIQRFKEANDPELQIQTILESAAEFLNTAFGIERDFLDINIIKKDSSKRCWQFVKRLQDSWDKTFPDGFESDSLASYVAECGHATLLVDKTMPTGKARYVLSDRDRDFGEGAGSIFCYRVKVNQHRKSPHIYIIAVITFRYQLCLSSENPEKINEIQKLLCEISTRLELEILVKSLRGN